MISPPSPRKPLLLSGLPLCGLLLVLLANTPAAAWQHNCAELCGAAAAIQSYGTGSEDLQCLKACESERADCSNAKGKYLWQTYLKCIDLGNPIEQCWPNYVDAKQCSVCDQGFVSPWEPSEVLFVNGPGCTVNGTQDGSQGGPFCKFNDGIDAAINRQESGRNTTVLVCEGTYREGYDGIDGRVINPPGLAQVVVESVTRHSAVISGSEDWSGVWLPDNVTITENSHNELLQGSGFNRAIWQKSLVDVNIQFIPDLPTLGYSASVNKVFRISAKDGTDGSAYLAIQQQVRYHPPRLPVDLLHPGACLHLDDPDLLCQRFVPEKLAPRLGLGPQEYILGRTAATDAAR